MSFGLLGLICALMAVSAQQLVEVSNALDLKYAMVNPAVTQLKMIKPVTCGRDWGPPIQLQRDIVITGAHPFISLNISAMRIIRLQGYTITFRQLRLIDSFQFIADPYIVDGFASGGGRMVWENVNATGYTYSLSGIESQTLLHQVTRNDYGNAVIQVRSQNTLYVDRLLDYPLNQIIEGTIKPSTITWTIFNSTLDCIPTPPPYFSVPKFSLTRFQPHQYVCQNRSDRGSSYRGVQNHALDAQGRPLECQEWDVIEPQYHSSTSSVFPQMDLRLNFCRNPYHNASESQRFSSVMCYTVAKVVTASCPVPFCEDLTDAQILDAYEKLARTLDASGRVKPPPPKRDSDSKSMRIGVTLGVVLGCTLPVLIWFIMFRYFRSKRRSLAGTAMLPVAKPELDSSIGRATPGLHDHPAQGSNIMSSKVHEAFVITPHNLELLSVLGKGGFGTVYLGRWDGSDVAVKVIPFSEGQSRSGLQEALLGIVTNHPNVVRVLGFFFAQKGSVAQLVPSTATSSIANSQRLPLERAGSDLPPIGDEEPELVSAEEVEVESTSPRLAAIHAVPQGGKVSPPPLPPAITAPAHANSYRGKSSRLSRMDSSPVPFYPGEGSMYSASLEANSPNPKGSTPPPFPRVQHCATFNGYGEDGKSFQLQITGPVKRLGRPAQIGKPVLPKSSQLTRITQETSSRVESVTSISPVPSVVSSTYADGGDLVLIMELCSRGSLYDFMFHGNLFATLGEYTAVAPTMAIPEHPASAGPTEPPQADVRLPAAELRPAGHAPAHVSATDPVPLGSQYIPMSVAIDQAPTDPLPVISPNSAALEAEVARRTSAAQELLSKEISLRSSPVISLSASSSELSTEPSRVSSGLRRDMSVGSSLKLQHPFQPQTLRRPFPQTLGMTTKSSGLSGSAPPVVPRLDGVPDIPAVLFIAREIAAGLVHLHTKNITHSDVKSLNVLLMPRSGFPYVFSKLCDMGTAEFVGLTRHEVINCTRMYIGPEVIQTGILTKENDVHAFGTVLWEMVHANWMRWASLGDNFEHLRRIHVPIPLRLAKLIGDCTRLNPAERPTIDAVLHEIMVMQSEFHVGPGSHKFRSFTGGDYLELAAAVPFAAGDLAMLTVCSYADISHWIQSYYAQFHAIRLQQEAASAVERDFLPT